MWLGVYECAHACVRRGVAHGASAKKGWPEPGLLQGWLVRVVQGWRGTRTISKGGTGAFQAPRGRGRRGRPRGSGGAAVSGARAPVAGRGGGWVTLLGFGVVSQAPGVATRGACGCGCVVCVW